MTVVVLLAVAGCGERPPTVSAGDESSAPSTLATDGTTTRSKPPPSNNEEELPAPLVAIHLGIGPEGPGGGRPLQESLVVMDPATGAVLRTLERSGVTAVELAPEGLAYAIRRNHPCGGELVRYRVDGSAPPEVVVAGPVSLLAASLDGNRLAFLASTPASAEACGPPRLIIRDLASGAERAWEVDIPPIRDDTRPVPTVYGRGVSMMSWSPDGQNLAVVAAGGVRLVDASKEGTLLDVASVPAKPGEFYEAAVCLGRVEKLLASRKCCTSDSETLLHLPTELVTIDPGSGAATPFSWSVKSGGQIPQPLVVASDETGEHLLITGGPGLSTPLFRLSGDVATLLSSESPDADW